MRLAVDGDAHQVQPERVLRRELARERRDVDAVVVVERRELVVDHLHDDVRGLALHEAGVHDVVGVHVAAALVLGLLRRELHLAPRSFPSRGARARPRGRCRRRRRAPCGARAARCACSRRSAGARSSCRRRRPARGAALRDSPAGTIGCAVLDRELRQRAPGRIVDARHDLGAGRRAELRLVGQLLQRIVVPELDLDAAVQRAALRRLVRAERPRRAAAVAVDGRRRRDSSASCTASATRRARAFESADVVAVDALVALGQRRVVGVADELHEHVLLVAQVAQRLRGSARRTPA